MRMTRENLLVRILPKENKIGSIILPNGCNYDWIRGEVVEVGSEVKEVKKGDIIIFPPHMMGGEFPTITIGDEELSVVTEKVVWAIE